MRRYRGRGVIAALLGVTVALAACAPFAESTPTAAPSPTATVSVSLTVGATVSSATPTPSSIPTVIPLPTATATNVPTVTLSPPTATTPAPTATAVSTATTAPSATVPLATATAIPPPLPPISPTPLTGASATDAQGRCAISLPAGFTATGGGTFSGASGQASITLTALTAGAGDTLDDVALPFVSTFSAAIGDYRQTAIARGADNLRLDFTGRTVAPGRGTVFLRQFGGTVCSLSFFVVQGGEVSYEQTVDALLASLRPAGAIGQGATRVRIA